MWKQIKNTVTFMITQIYIAMEWLLFTGLSAATESHSEIRYLSTLTLVKRSGNLE